MGAERLVFISMSYDNAGAKRAMDAYSAKMAKKYAPKPPRKKNKTPEKDVEKQVIIWLKAQGFFYNVIEAKAVYNQKSGGYRKGQVAPGYPDISGCTPNGMACFIELKAPKLRHTVSYEQHTFLKKVIGYGCFAVVCDSVDNLMIQYQAWVDGEDLMKYLPKKNWAEDDNSPLF